VKLLAHPWFSFAAVLAAPFACSSSSSSPGAGQPGEGPDASTEASASDSPAPSGDACGAPPYVNLGLIVRSATDSGANGTPVAGAKLTASLCPSVVRVSAADGTISAQVSKGVPFYARFEAQNYANTLLSEVHFDADKTGIVAPLPPAIFTALVPGGFGPDKTAVVVGVMKDGGTGACDQLDGVALDVPGHPEAKVTYLLPMRSRSRRPEPPPRPEGARSSPDSGPT
jgi:hypothetical protein